MQALNVAEKQHFSEILLNFGQNFRVKLNITWQIQRGNALRNAPERFQAFAKGYVAKPLGKRAYEGVWGLGGPSRVLDPARHPALLDLTGFCGPVQRPHVAQGHVTKFGAEVERFGFAHWVRGHVGPGQVLGDGVLNSVLGCEHDVLQ